MRIIQHHMSVTLIGFIVMMTLACDGSNGPVTGPATTGAIHLTVSTEGANADLDIDGYDVLVDGAGPKEIGVQGAVTIDHLNATSHFVTLDGLASNCSVAASNGRWVDVVAGGLAELSYNVKCNPTPGDCGWDCLWSQSVPAAIDVADRER